MDIIISYKQFKIHKRIQFCKNKKQRQSNKLVYHWVKVGLYWGLKATPVTALLLSSGIVAFKKLPKGEDIAKLKALKSVAFEGNFYKEA